MSDPAVVRDFLYVDDAVALFVALLAQRSVLPRGLVVLNAGSGVGTSLAALIAAAARASNVQVQVNLFVCWSFLF